MVIPTAGMMIIVLLMQMKVAIRCKQNDLKVGSKTQKPVCRFGDFQYILLLLDISHMYCLLARNVSARSNGKPNIQWKFGHDFFEQGISPFFTVNTRFNSVTHGNIPDLPTFDFSLSITSYIISL